MIVVTKIGSILCFDMFEVIFIMLSLMKTESSYVSGHCCLSVLYKIEAIIQYCEINFTNILVKASTSVIILLLWCTIEKLNPKSSWYQRQTIGILPSYSSISLTAEKSHNNQKFCPQIRCLFCTIDHLPYAVSPTN